MEQTAIKMSPQINEVVAAMAKAALELTTVAYDSVNPHYRNKYASLAAFEKAIRVPLAKQGLHLFHCVGHEDGQHTVTTVLGHASGQWIASTMRLLLNKQDMQGLGSAITYAKRYQVGALVGVSADEDDDAEKAIEKDPPPLPPAQGRPKQPVTLNADDPGSYVVPVGPGTIKGRTLKEVGAHEARKTLDWFIQHKKGDPTVLKQFERMLALYIEQRAKGSEEPPKFEPSEELPF